MQNCTLLSRYPWGLFWQNLLLRPAVPISPGLILTKSLATPRCYDIAGAYSDRISFYAPLFRGRRGLFRKNLCLRPIKNCPVQSSVSGQFQNHEKLNFYSRFAFTSSNSCSISSEGALVARLTAMIAISPSPKPTTREYRPVALPRVCPPTRGM